ncbi:MAG: Glu/Leu/Phe/Val family dehydrogenase, partial [Candidatus Roizmanbacteria bacterium]
MKSNPYTEAMLFLDSLSSSIAPENKPFFDRLKKPNHIHKKKLSLILDSGKKESFEAYRIQYNDALGPYKGGIRFHPGVTEDEVKALSFWMSIKSAVSGIPYGGGKGGIVVEPSKLSQKELERLSRAYSAFITPYIGIDTDVPAPDVNTGPEIMAWMLDEYEKTVGHHEPGVFTGKPLALGGSVAREQATGYGGVMAMDMLLSALNIKKKDMTVAIQGFGNVGYFFAKTAHTLGYKIVAVSDSKGAIYSKEGLNPNSIFQNKKFGGTLKPQVCCEGDCECGFEAKDITNQELLELDVDILVPSALEGVISDDNMNKIKAPIIIEMANGPLTTGADTYLTKKGTIILPDIFANAGGVIGSYLEWVQNRTGWYFDEKEGLDKQTTIMKKAFESIWRRYTALEKSSKSLRIASYLVAIE